MFYFVTPIDSGMMGKSSSPGEEGQEWDVEGLTADSIMYC